MRGQTGHSNNIFPCRSVQRICSLLLLRLEHCLLNKQFLLSARPTCTVLYCFLPSNPYNKGYGESTISKVSSCCLFFQESSNWGHILIPCKISISNTLLTGQQIHHHVSSLTSHSSSSSSLSFLLSLDFSGSSLSVSVS